MGAVAFPLEHAVARMCGDLLRPEPAAVADPSKLSAPLLESWSDASKRSAPSTRGELSASAFRGADAELSAQVAAVDAELGRARPRRPRRS